MISASFSTVISTILAAFLSLFGGSMPTEVDANTVSQHEVASVAQAEDRDSDSADTTETEAEEAEPEDDSGAPDSESTEATEEAEAEDTEAEEESDSEATVTVVEEVVEVKSPEKTVKPVANKVTQQQKDAESEAAEDATVEEEDAQADNEPAAENKSESNQVEGQAEVVETVGNAQSNDLTAALNAYRASHGLPALTETNKMDAAAQHWADFMAENGDFRHDANDIATYGARLENLAILVSDDITDESLDWWINSPTHNANLLDNSVTTVGYGWAVYKTGPKAGQLVIVQRFV